LIVSGNRCRLRKKPEHSLHQYPENREAANMTFLIRILFLVSVFTLSLSGHAASVSGRNLPQGLGAALSNAMHQVEETKDGFQAFNPRNNQHLSFHIEGLHIEPTRGEAPWQAELGLAGLGNESDIHPLAEAVMSAEGRRVSYRYNELTQWFENGSTSLTWGFTIPSPPEDAPDRLVLSLSVKGDLTPRWKVPGKSLDLVRSNHTAPLTWGQPRATDADGQILPSRLTLDGSNPNIVVDTREARFPVIIALKTTNEQKVLPLRGEAEDRFGFSVAISGTTALVGVVYADENGTDSGSAYIFVHDGTNWTKQALLLPGDGETNDQFGWSVALSGDTALIGANGEDELASGAGAAYVFVRSGTSWSQQVKLMAGDGAAGDYFGSSVAVDTDTALVGATGDDDKGSNAGSAYVFVRSATTWSQQAKLLADDGAAGDQFGTSVSLSADTVAIGANQDDDQETDSGSVHVFLRSGTTWTSEAKLLAGDIVSYGKFGTSVSIDGDTLLVGASGNDGQVTDSGAAYVFFRNSGSWTQQAKLQASDGAIYDRFGYSVSLDNDTALIGAYNNDTQASNAGAAYVFLRSGTSWSQQAKLLDSNGIAGDGLGLSVALSGDRAVVSSPAADDIDSNAGAVTTFVRSGGSWSQDDQLLAIDGGSNDRFGNSVALDGDTALIGAQNAEGTGAAWIFVHDGAHWVQQAKLLPGDASKYFGVSVVLSGDTALIGAHWADNDSGVNTGAAYVYQRSNTTWTQQAKLLASDGANTDYFGIAVALDGDTALIGSERDDDMGTDSGSAYVFVRSGTSWSEEAKITPSDGAADDRFGGAVALEGNTALISAMRNDNSPGTDSGATYVYVRNNGNWELEQKLGAPDASLYDFFGSSVALYGDKALIGVTGDDDNGSGSGSAHVFFRNNGSWTHEAKLLASDGADYDYFGTSVALFGNTALVGASWSDHNGENSGSAYLFMFDGTNWSQQAIMTSADGAASDYFGEAVALSNDTALVGAWGNDDASSGSGSAYFYDVGFTVGGNLSGLAGGTSLILQNNGGDNLTLDADGNFTFDTALANGSSYNVTILSQPASPNQTCTVSNDSGTISSADVTNISVICVTNTYSVGGMVSGLATGNSVVLQNSGGDDLSVDANGSFTFPTALADGSTYNVTVLTQPTTPNQTCTLTNSSGNLNGADVTSIEVVCTINTYTVGGTISGMVDGSTMVLRNNGGDDLSVNANGPFVFNTALEDGSSYEVTILSQPDSPRKICSVNNGSGSVTGENVITVEITCADLFTDAGVDHWAYDFIQALGASGITGGCTATEYCPDDDVTRAAMAIFLERGMRGSDFVPPPATGTVFSDVPLSHWAAAWIEQLAADQITGGCDANKYCPEESVTRAQMAIFLLRAEHGKDYGPPLPTGTVFDDVPLTHWAVAWIEQLAKEGVTGGCDTSNYCPAQPVTRAQMAVFLTRIFNL
jgi:hypothetical protein